MIFEVGTKVRINKIGWDSGWDYMIEKFKIPKDYIFTIQKPHQESRSKSRGGICTIESYGSSISDREWIIYADCLELAYPITDLDEDDEGCI